MVAVHLGQLRDGAGGVRLGELHLDTVVEAHVPAAVGNAHGGAEARRNLRMRAHHVHQLGRMAVGAVADKKRQAGEARLGQLLDGLALAVDDRDDAADLPQREGLRLGDLDAQRVGIELLDRRLAHPGQAEKALARGERVEGQKRGLGAEVERLDDLVLGRFLAAGDLHRRDAEPAERGQFARGAHGAGPDVAEMFADDAAVDEARRQQAGGGEKPRVIRQIGCDPRIVGAVDRAGQSRARRHVQHATTRGPAVATLICLANLTQRTA